MDPQLVGDRVYIAFNQGFSLSGDFPSSSWKRILEW